MVRSIISLHTSLRTIFVVMLLVASNPAFSDGLRGNVTAEGVGILGYDPVAYFTRGRPVLGKTNFEYEHKGVTYRFVNANHLAMFEAAPDKYTPSYGGYCAFGIRYGQKSKIDPTRWKIVDGKLHLLLNAGTMVAWERKQQENIKIADRNWKSMTTSE